MLYGPPRRTTASKTRPTCRLPSLTWEFGFPCHSLNRPESDAVVVNGSTRSYRLVTPLTKDQAGGALRHVAAGRTSRARVARDRRYTIPTDVPIPGPALLLPALPCRYRASTRLGPWRATAGDRTGSVPACNRTLIRTQDDHARLGDLQSRLMRTYAADFSFASSATGTVMPMAYSRQWLVDTLRRLGFPQEADEALQVLPAPQCAQPGADCPWMLRGRPPLSVTILTYFVTRPFVSRCCHAR